MESLTLIHIDPPNKDRNPSQVGKELMHLLDGDFCYSTHALCQLLLCDRQWIDLTFRPVIRHICITHYFRDYMLTHLKLSEQERTLLSQGFIFYSFSDLKKNWYENAVASRKTQLIDLANYQKECFTADLTNEMEYHQSVSPNKKEKSRHMARMSQLLTEEGFILYQMSLSSSKEWIPCPTPPLSSSLVLTNLAKERRMFHLNSNASAMQHLLRKGGVRIKFGSRSLWVLPEISKYRVPVAIPADMSLDLPGNLS